MALKGLEEAQAAPFLSRLSQHAAADGQAASIRILKRWLRTAASLLDADAACIVVRTGTMARSIVRHKLPFAFVATDQMRAAPFERREIVVLPDCRDRADVQAFVRPLMQFDVGMFYRRPLAVDDDRVISLMLFGKNARSAFDPRDLALADAVAEAMAAEVIRRFPLRTGSVSDSLNLTLAEIEAWHGQTDVAALILDADLSMRAVNDPLRSLLPLDWNAMIGRKIGDIGIPAADSLDKVFQRARESGLSTPPLEMAIQSADVGAAFKMRIVASPLTPIDGAPLLVATIDPASLALVEDEAAYGVKRGEFADRGQPVAEFLLETLVRRRTLRARNNVSYVTLHAWRQPIREYQIKALRAVKRHAPMQLAPEIAAEIAADVDSLFGVRGFRAVVPMPCGHSSDAGCLSAEIAKELGKLLAVPVVHALSLPKQSGSSHPKTNAKRAPMRLVDIVEGLVLLIDDVVTSGRHIEEATKLLRAAGAGVLAMAWIGGNVE